MTENGVHFGDVSEEEYLKMREESINNKLNTMDKRTKEYKQMKKAQDKQKETIKRVKRVKERKESKGLGDTIEKVLEATKVDKVAKFILGDDCGCDKRKEFLNKVFPYKVECLVEDEYNSLKEFFEKNPRVVGIADQRILLKIYNRVFNKRNTESNCASCVRSMVADLRKVFNEYEEDRID